MVIFIRMRQVDTCNSFAINDGANFQFDGLIFHRHSSIKLPCFDNLLKFTIYFLLEKE